MISIIDKGIKRREQYKTGERAKFWRKVYHYCKPLKVLALTFYILVSQLEQPAFCVHLLQAGTEDFNPATCNNSAGDYTNFNWPKLRPGVTRPLEMFALAVMLFLQWAHFQYREFDRGSLWAWRGQIALTIASYCSMVLNLVLEQMQQTRAFPWGCAFARPFILLAQFRTLRQYMVRYVKVMFDSMPMGIFIFGYVIYYSWMGQKLFAGTLQGVLYMEDFGDSFFNMFVLMTTSNYPDIMLPAYGENRLYFVFFGSYLLIGLFLIMNLLLAIVYSNFKARFEEHVESREKSRALFLSKRFFEIIEEGNEYLRSNGRQDEIDPNRDYLTKCEMYKFFMTIHSIVERNEQDVFDQNDTRVINR